MIRFRPKQLRSRLTLWYAGVLAAALLLFVTGTSFSLVLAKLRTQLDRYNIQDVETVEGLLFFTPSGHLELKKTTTIILNRSLYWSEKYLEVYDAAERNYLVQESTPRVAFIGRNALPRRRCRRILKPRVAKAIRWNPRSHGPAGSTRSTGIRH